jgi:hypothetical protein
MKFMLTKGKGSVQGFTDEQGVTHMPGDVVELPASYKGLKWLKPVEKEVKPVAPASKAEAMTDAPLPEKKSPKAK